MRKLLASIEKKAVKNRPELIAFIKDVQTKEATFEKLKAQKDAAKIELKLAAKTLKKQLKSKPSQKETAKAAGKSIVAPKKAVSHRNDKTLAKKNTGKVIAA